MFLQVVQKCVRRSHGKLARAFNRSMYVGLRQLENRSVKSHVAQVC